MNTTRRTLTSTLIAATLTTLTACGGGGGGNDSTAPGTPGDSGNALDVAGEWRITERVVSATCPDDVDTQSSYDLQVAQDGSRLTVTAPVGVFSGAIDGDQIEWTGSFDEDGGRTTINSMNVKVSGETLSGTSQVTWAQGATVCELTIEIDGTRTSGGSPDPDEDAEQDDAEELSFFEEELVGSWSRFHAFDGSTDYFVFFADRTACKFTVEDNGSRTDEVEYQHWALVHDEDDVYRIELQSVTADTPYLSSHEYHFNADEIWRGGFANLVMTQTAGAPACDD